MMLLPSPHGAQPVLSRFRRTVLVGVVLLGACVSTQAARLGSGTIRPPVSPDKVAIYLTADRVPGKYEEVALLTSKGDYGSTNEEKMYRSMREKAGELGANAIILESVKEPGTGAKVARALIGTGANREGKAIAIFILADTTKAP
jgi:hypothetical protein